MNGRPVFNLGKLELVERMAGLLRGREPLRLKEIQTVLWDKGLRVSTRDVWRALKCGSGKRTFGRFHGKAAGGVPTCFYYVNETGISELNPSMLEEVISNECKF